MKRGIRIAALLALAAGACGCQQLLVPFYLFGPDPYRETIEAEFNELPKHSVAIVVYADQKVLYEYPSARYDISYLLGQQLRANVKDLTVVAPDQVVAFQEKDLQWDMLDKTALGKRLGADFVLYVTIVYLGTHEPGSANLYRGTLNAEAALYRTDKPERESRVWRAADLNVLFPEKGKVSTLVGDDSQIRDQTVKAFVDKLAKKFYKYERPREFDNDDKNKNKGF